jgi:hypothetical protein
MSAKLNKSTKFLSLFRVIEIIDWGSTIGRQPITSLLVVDHFLLIKRQNLIRRNVCGHTQNIYFCTCLHKKKVYGGTTRKRFLELPEIHQGQLESFPWPSGRFLRTVYYYTPSSLHFSWVGVDGGKKAITQLPIVYVCVYVWVWYYVYILFFFFPATFVRAHFLTQDDLTPLIFLSFQLPFFPPLQIIRHDSLLPLTTFLCLVKRWV